MPILRLRGAVFQGCGHGRFRAVCFIRMIGIMRHGIMRHGITRDMRWRSIPMLRVSQLWKAALHG